MTMTRTSKPTSAQMTGVMRAKVSRAEGYSGTKRGLPAPDEQSLGTTIYAGGSNPEADPGRMEVPWSNLSLEAPRSNLMQKVSRSSIRIVAKGVSIGIAAGRH